MEFPFQPISPGDRPVLIPRAPYVSRNLYDGGSFTSFPTRVGKAGMSRFSFEHYRAEQMNPTPLEEQESFYQTWLFFGFVAEFLGINIPDEELSASETLILTKDEILTWMYKTLVVEDGNEKFVRMDEEWLNSAQQIARSRFIKDPASKMRHFSQLIGCLTIAYPMLQLLPVGFNHTVKSSISIIYEFMNHLLRLIYSRAKAPFGFSRNWSVDFLNEEAQAAMRANGWCRSDIARLIVRFRTIQALNMARMIDKSLPKRDHSNCTDSNCTSFQIDLRKYEVWHHDEHCQCTQLVVDSAITTNVLLKKDKYPLLKLEGDLHEMRAEIVESTPDTPYIAISHVWADGLGNPKANALFRCKLHHLRTLVSGISPSYLLWLDTLCCPTENGHGKQLAIEKIRLVYTRAAHVLVLDAGLMTYTSSTLQPHELALRIFTSSWMRRLWTLQEGALAHSLYFQFADKAISLNSLRAEFNKISTHMPIEILRTDILNELRRLDAFFHNDGGYAIGNTIAIVDQALQFRGVSVPSDEPLCIATLLSLDLQSVLVVGSQEERMCVVWKLVAEKYGISASIIFLEGSRLSTTGFKWALKSLLEIEKSVRPSNARLLCWNDSQKGALVPKTGLKVKYPGIRLRFRNGNADGKGRNPWLGLPRVSEYWLQFRNLEDGKWWRIVDCKFEVIRKQWTDEEKNEWKKLKLFPLCGIVEEGNAVLILNELGDNPKGIREGILAAESKEDRSKDGDGIKVTTRKVVMICDMGEEGYLYDVIEKLAHSLRADPLTDKHVDLLKELNPSSDQDVLKDLKENNEPFKESMKRLRDKLKEMMEEVIREDEKFVQTVTKFYGAQCVGDQWVLVRDWFCHDIVGERVCESECGVGGGSGVEIGKAEGEREEEGVWWIVG